MYNQNILYMLPDNKNIESFYINYTANDENAGFDLYTPEDIYFKPWETKFVDMGFKCMMKTDDNLVSYFLYPRSSLSKTGLILANSVGIIDKSYRGNIIAALRYIPLDMTSNEILKINKGTRLVQLCASNLNTINLVMTDSLPTSNRGDGGFGSTNK